MVNTCESERIRVQTLGTTFTSRVSVSGQLLGTVEQLIETARRVSKASASSVLLVDHENRDLIFKVATGKVEKKLRGLRTSSQHSIAGWVAIHAEPLIVNDVAGDWRFDKMIDTITGFVTRSLMCVPLIESGETVGVIEVVNKLDGTVFSPDDLNALLSIAQETSSPGSTQASGHGGNQ